MSPLQKVTILNEIKWLFSIVQKQINLKMYLCFNSNFIIIDNNFLFPLLSNFN